MLRDETLVFQSNTLNRHYPHKPSQPTALDNIKEKLVSKILLFSPVLVSLSVSLAVI